MVIRSSVLPHVFQGCAKIFEKQAPGLVILCANPEFLREGSAIRDFENPPYTILGTDNATAEAVLRDLYASLEAPVYVVSPHEALMIKYAGNVFHGMKVAFANEIGAICKAQGIDSHAVMSTFIKDSTLNVSPRYLRPGFAFGGSCLPKDIRAILSVSRQYELPTPLISGILASNESLLDRAYHLVMQKGKRKVGLVGLSFKPNSDDLRESPLADLAGRLFELKNIELRIYDPNVRLAMASDLGEANVRKSLGGMTDLLSEDLSGIMEWSELLIIGHGYPEISDNIRKISADCEVLDFAYMPELIARGAHYDGINW